jgi:EAL domain-containing protein (putative c-di-GMP-specific phosphodiesterase class I)
MGRGKMQPRYLKSAVTTLTGWNDPETRLRRAFQNDEFILFGQSIAPLDPAKNLPLGLEILIRLREEEDNLMPPGTFIPILDYVGMMPVLDRWVLEHAAVWWRQRNGVPNTALHINLSPQTLNWPDFPDFVAQQLRFGGVRPDRVCFELTGSEIAAASQQSVASIKNLKAAGCRFAVTAFDRNTISFEALRAVGASAVKLDGAIVRELARDPAALSKVISIQRVCSKAGLLTVAEFVEQPETLARLRELGIDYVQGYGVAKPAPLDAAADCCRLWSARQSAGMTTAAVPS